MRARVEITACLAALALAPLALGPLAPAAPASNAREHCGDATRLVRRRRGPGRRQRLRGAGSSSIGSSVADVAVEDLGTTGRSVVDLGGGPLGSVGGNCLRGGLLAANVIGYAVWARGGWWGTPDGPGLLRTLALGGSLDAGEPLSEPPAWCG